MSENNYTGLEIAVIGMAGRFPGAANIEEFWDNLKNGVESVSFFSDKELREAGVREELLNNPNYIKAVGYLEDVEKFDADFFDYAPMEAEVLEPQVRLFHECAWKALEHAGYVPDTYDGLIGLYAGASDSFNWKSLAVLSGKVEKLGQFEVDQLTNKDYLCARTAYKFNLKGPVVFVQTACSTSLVAIHMACQGLLSGESDIALAGGVTIIPLKAGYFYQEGMIQSPDGHCRAFDGSARGTLPANGLGIVVLKRLEEAVEDGDTIHAVIKGSAINNDGTQKIGFTAPSVEGQAEAIKEAFQAAQVETGSIGCVEAHGTGTTLGDPVEIEALTLAFNTTKKGFCGIGSVKSNFGHLDSAAGVAGFIKTVLVLKHRLIPPTLHFNLPNSRINFINSPFYINADLKPWENENNQQPRRAGVSSLGIGGTNAHVVLEEWCRGEPLCSPEDRDYHLILLSAKKESALIRLQENLAEYLEKNPSINLADAAYTLQVGRKAFKHRWAAICSTPDETIDALNEETKTEVLRGSRGQFFKRAPWPPEAVETAQAWLDGQAIDWSEFYREDKQRRCRIPLPAYPFEGQCFWMEGDLLNLGAEMFLKKSQAGINKKADMADWFYLPSWKRAGISIEQTQGRETPGGFCRLLFIDRRGLGSQLAARLNGNGEFIVIVEAGPAFQKVNDRQFILNPRQERDYDALFNELAQLDKIPRGIVHLWSVTGGDNVLADLELDRVINARDMGFYSLLNIARSMGKQGIEDEVRLFVVSDNMQEVTGEDGLFPEKAVILGPVKVIPTEYPTFRCFSIDVELPLAGSRGEKRLIHQLVEELTWESHDPVIAYRGGYRWVQVFEPRPFGESVKGKENIQLRHEGVYLVTGGLGGIGLALAEYLAGSARAKLVLTGRRELPAEERRQKVTGLEQLGAEVLVCTADVTDYEQMHRVFVKAEEFFGPINGIIHCAGLPDGEMIQRRTSEASERIFAAKATGTLVLDSLMKGMEKGPDFFVLCSSVTAILPMIGQVAYCAANAFLDAFAHYRNIHSYTDNGPGTVTLSVNWDRWQHVGIAVIAEDQHEKLTGEELVGGITREQGIEVFDRVLANKEYHSQVVVSAWDFEILLEQAYAFNASAMMEGLEEITAPKTILQRPELNSEYVAPNPGNKTQEKLAHMWENFFGFQQVGIRDDFFELGGDSLKALVLLPKIHKELDVYIPIAEFFNRPTIRELSEYIAGADKSFYSSIEPVEKKRYYPLSSAQKRLYLLQQMDLHSTGYNILTVLPVGKDIEKDKLESAFRKLIARHESLRTSFIMVKDMPVQEIHDDVEFKMGFYEPVGSRGEPLCSPLQAGETINNFIRPFDLSKAPLLRSGIIKNPDGNYTWFIDVHHIVSDGISQAILTGDFMVLYNGEAMEPLRFQYKDFSEWQNRLFSSDEIKEQEDYWLKLYGDAQEISRLNLPTDYKRPEVFTFAGDHYGFTIEKEDAAELRKLVSGNGGTLFMGILAVLNVLFYKYSGQGDIIIGSGTAGRPRDDLEGIIGMFVNTLVMRNYPRGGKTYVSFLKEVIAHSLKAFENQDVQFEELVNKLDLERDPSRNPLFDISIVSLNFSLPEEVEEMQFFVDENFSLIDAAYNNPTSRFDMTFFVHEPGEEVYINIEYYTAIFKEETIRRMVSHFRNVIKAVVEKPSIKLRDIEIVTEEEKEQVLYKFNDTVSEYPGDRTIHELFAEEAGKAPDHTAVVFEDAIITYSELNRRSDNLAAYLHSKGVQREEAVGIMLERSIEMVAGLLGILKSGGAYLPIDLSYPEERKKYIMQDSSARILVRVESGVFDLCRGEPLCSPGASFHHSSFIEKPNHSVNLAYIIYTSGSTGKPKGVMVGHSNVVRLVKNTNYIRFDRGDRLLQNGALAFDISTFEIWGPLLNGSILVLADKESLLDAESLGFTLAKYDISLLHLIPQLFNQLAGQDPAIFQGLNCLLVGGDLVRPEFINIVRKRCSNVKILHMYGPTENTTFSSFLPVRRAYEIAVPIGKPLANSTVYILGQTDELMPVGLVGEICTGGDGVARGYLNQPELTAEKFVFYHEGHEGVYRTGDLAKWLPDGNIEFLGRKDHQVKIRGVRIELEEIGNHLLAKEGIKEAVVLAPKEGLEAKYLCAYIVSERKFELSELGEMLSGDLPSAMIPSYFVQLDKMPLTATGKIDRKALPDPVLESGSRTPYIAPGDAFEKKLAEIWSMVLGVDDPIGIDDNFFHLGGHSLNAAILTSKIHKELEVKVPLAEVFKNQTVRRLAEYIKHTKETKYVGIHPVEKREYYKLSSAQKRLYLLQQIDNNSIGYNMPLVLPFDKDIEKETLESTLKKVIARHESLRTSFIIVEDIPVQRVHDNVGFEMEYYGPVDSGQWAVDSRGEPLCSPGVPIHHSSFNIHHFVRPFDLSLPPLLRSGIIKIPGGNYIWIVDMHHIISDGISQTVFLEDFLSFYGYTGEKSESSNLPIQYKDFSQWQNRLLETGDIKAQEEYWLNLYPDAEEIPRLNLPGDYKRPEVFTFTGSNYGFKLKKEDAVKFRAQGLADGGTLYMNVLAALNVLFYKYTGQEDIIIGSGIAGRPRDDLQRIMGMFVNTLAMRNYPGEDKTYRYFLKEVIAHSIDAFENQDVQFEHLVDRLDIERDTSRNPLFDIVMLVQNFQQVQLKEGIVENLPTLAPDYKYKNITAKFDITFFIYESGEDIFIDMEYYTGIFKEETVKRLASHFRNVIGSVVEQPSIKLKDIEVISEEEKEQVLYEFNDTASEYPKDRTIHELFAGQAKKAPDRTAVVFEDREITYKELDRASESLAVYLHEKGVCREDAVGIMSERSLEMVIGILGILKAGAAYLPIDVEYPEERKKYIMQDSNARILLSEEGGVIDLCRGEPLCSPGVSFHHSSFIEKPNHSVNLAYIIYTSGSTGKPKGVMVEHRGVVRLVKNTNYIQFRPGDRILQTGALEFDASTFEIWGALLNGLTLFLIKKDNVLAAGQLKETIRKYDIGTAWMTAPLFNQMLQTDIDIFSGLKNLLVGGDVLSPYHINRLKKRLPGLQVINGYGPTENTTFSTTFLIGKEYDENIPIGKPIANSFVYILNNAGHVQAVNVPGEICVGGDGVARGYLNNPELTAGKFLAAKTREGTKRKKDNQKLLRGVQGGGLLEKSPPGRRRLYKTGDLGRWLPDGTIEFLGRKDFQVKIRGFRVELEEIENYLLAEKEIKDAVVAAVREGTGVKYLCAYIVSDRKFGPQELGENLSCHLPTYMIPSYFVQVENIPLTANGKVDWRSLPESKPGACPDRYAAPRDEIEEILAAIWSDVLGLDTSIGIDDNFFHLGGHSLSAAVLISKIHKTFDVKVPLVEIFIRQTVKTLAEYIRRAGKAKYTDIIPVEKKDYYPLSSAQKRLYFLQQMDINSTGYNMPFVLPLGRDVEKDRLASAFRKLIARHESLRTSFGMVNEEPVQRVHDHVEFEIDYFDPVDSEQWTVDSRGEPLCSPPQLGATIKNFIRPFDLSKAPLLRSGIIKTPEGDHIWMVDLHHIISDGTSQAILSENFITLYNNRELEPLDLRLGYKDFSQWQNRLFEKGEIKAQGDYWLEQYEASDNIPVLSLPADYKRPEVFTFAGDTYKFVLDREEALKFKKLGSRNSATLYMNLLAVLNVLFYKYTGQTDIIIGTGIAGRRHADLEGIIGMFVNTLAVRNYPEGEKNYELFLKETAAHSIKAFENQDVQFEDLVDKLDLERNPSRNPLFDVTMVVQNFRKPGEAVERLNPGQEESTPLEFRNPAAKFDLTFFTYELQEDIYIDLEYYTAIFKPGTVQRMASHFKNIIKAVIDNPTVKLKDIDIVSEEEKVQLLYEFNNTTREYPPGKTIIEFFIDRLRKTPGKIALVYEDKALTYARLDRAANRLANYLIFSGKLQREEPVGVLMEKAIDQVIALLGVLKAGSAYLPIDDSLPEARVKHMIADSGLGIVLSQKKFIRLLNRLQWECKTFHTFLCMDSSNIYAEEETEKSRLMDEKLWDYVAESATDDVTGGGWFTSYTGEPFTAAEMEEYGDNILKKLSPLLHREMRVLDIGCGSGFSMYRLAPRVGFYYAADLSEKIIEMNRKRVREEGHKNIFLSALPAHDIDKIPQRDFDLVIINSVIQSFHGHNYLRKVIGKAIDLLTGRGYLFIGDILDRDLQEDLAREMNEFKYSSKGNVKTKTDWSADLFVSRSFFKDLKIERPEIRGIEFSSKIYTIENELTKFRYDTLITVDKKVEEKRKIKTKHKYQHDITAVEKFSTGLPETAAAIDPGNLAYIIYTSGSTGLPKGVMVGHRNVVRLVKNSNYIDYMDFKTGDRFLLTGAFSFDITTFEIWGLLLNGIGLYMVEKNVMLDVEQLRETVLKNNISIMHFIPQLLNQQVENSPGIFAALGTLLVGGDLVSAGTIAYLRNTYPRLKILHMYGPTENTTFSTFFPVENADAEHLPIGKPISNSTVFILDRNGGMQPPGIFGELCTGGDGVARGYLNNPELTAENFIFYHEGHEGVYRTGDLARWLSDGNIEFSGRIDHQVKIRGFRIELGEIENRLLNHREIKEAVVLTRDTQLCAYIVSNVELDLSELREFLSRQLPGYMVPSHFVQVEEMPLTSSGKIDRKALPSPEIEASSDYVAPRHQVEKKLVKIWSEVLGVGHLKIGIDDNFFRLGGHSLKATMLAAKIYKEIEVKVSLADIFKMQTIRGLSEIIKKLPVEGFVEIEPAAKKEYYELSFNQKRLWFIQQKNLEDNSYNMPAVMALNENVDEELIKHTIGAIIEKHESLRTGFKEVDGEAVQFVVEKDNLEFDFAAGDISSLGAGEKKSELKKIIDKFCSKPFRLDEPPLFQSLLIKESDDRYIFAYNIHHIVSDGWSMQILERDFRYIYESCRDNVSKIAREEPAVTYKDFACWHNRQLGAAAGKQMSRRFWGEFLKAELPLLRLPTDFDYKGKEKAGARFRFVLPGNIKDTLKQLSRQYNITLFSLLYSVYNIFLSVVSGQRTVVSSIVNAGRDHPSLQDIVGFFVNSVIFKKQVDPDQVFIDFAGELHGSVLEFFKHQNYPLELVLDEVGMKYPEVTASFNMVNVRDNEAIPLEHPAPSHSRDFAIQDVKFDIEPYISEYSNGIEIDVSYNKNLFKAENIEYMMKKYRQLIEFFALNPLKRIKDHKETKKRKSFKRKN